MTARTHPFLIQAAGVRNVREARLLVDCGVDLVGIPLRLDTHVPDVSERKAAGIARKAGLAAQGCRGGRGVCITYETDPQRIVSLCAGLGVDKVQLHSPGAGASTCAMVKSLAPRLLVIKSLVVAADNQDELEGQVAACAGFADAFITDTHDPDTGASGATGRTHDWTVSAHLVGISPRPVILAGGLTPENVARAVQTVRPAGVDAHTGLEDERGRKDEARVRAFVAAARQAAAELAAEAGDG
jgi:phosphoribosylanthranilate isomerase